MVTHRIFHKLDLLSEQDFKALVQHKENIIGKGKGAITIEKDGSITINDNKKYGLEDSNNFFSYEVSKEAIINLNDDIEHFIPVLGEPFRKAFDAIEKSLLDFEVKNPKPYSARCYRNNKKMRWHRHTMRESLKRQNFWVAIYYLHPNWDINYGGDLQVGLSDQEVILNAPCLSNSLVVHNGYYGHGVESLTLGYSGDRDIFLTHWVSD